MVVQPYLHFDGRCEEALQFYRQALDAEIVMLVRYQDSPEPLPPEMADADLADKVMHANLRIGDTTLMACDDCTGGASRFQGFSLCLTAADEAVAQRRYAALVDGGVIHMPLGPTFFSPCFGMLADRFGVTWMVIVQPPPMAAA